MRKLVPVILSGGAGTRLWPVSREANPKPFIQLPDGQSLLQKTFLRALAVSDVADITEIMTVTNREYYFRTKDEYEAIINDKHKLPQLSYILEPEGRNTAPAIGLAALALQKRYGNEVMMLVMPADHLVSNQTIFLQALSAAIDAAAQGEIVTFGIRPTAPDTGYGYIETDTIDLNRVTKAHRFVEKPDLETAKRYLVEGCYVWNSGMFCFQAGVFLDKLALCAPELFSHITHCFDVSHTAKNHVLELDKSTFSAVSSISVDYAVMEKAEGVSVVPCDIGWSDVGSWDAISALVDVDHAGNRYSGSAMLHDVNNTYIQSEGRLIVALGVNDLVIIDTDDAVLVSHKDRVQDVRQIVQRLKKDGHESYKYHRTVYRPWGTFTVLEEGSGFKIKRIVVKPGQRLSLQMHHHRCEHWIVVRGVANIVNGDISMVVNTNESTYIPAGHQHRLENPGVIDLVLIEVQSGDYLGEDDIVRLEDVYGRV